MLESFPNEFYKVSLDWTDKFVLENIDTIESNYEKYPNRNRWMCNCHVIHDNDTDVPLINFEFLREKYETLAKDLCEMKGLNFSHISQIWYNYYKFDQYQESHIHEGIGYTFVHYMLFDPAEHQKTYFCDPQLESPEVKQGDAIFFPSFYYHYVPSSTTNKPRLTTAFTLMLKA